MNWDEALKYYTEQWEDLFADLFSDEVREEFEIRRMLKSRPDYADDMICRKGTKVVYQKWSYNHGDRVVVERRPDLYLAKTLSKKLKILRSSEQGEKLLNALCDMCTMYPVR